MTSGFFASAPHTAETERVLVEVAPLKQGRHRKRYGSNATYDGLDVVDFLQSLGLRGVRRKGSEVSYSCPGPEHRRGDLNPSASMRADTKQFKCFHCSDEFGQGNAATLLVAFLRLTEGEVITNGDATKRLIARDYLGQEVAKPRARKTTARASGSLSELHERARFAFDLLDRGVSYTKTVTALGEYFRVSRRTAERDVAAARGKTRSRITEVGGKTKVLNRRRMSAARLALRSGHEEIAMTYQADLSNTLSRIVEVDGNHVWDHRKTVLANIEHRLGSESSEQKKKRKRSTARLLNGDAGCWEEQAKVYF